MRVFLILPIREGADRNTRRRVCSPASPINMRFDFHNAWVHIVIELFPRPVLMRRYRVARDNMAWQARRRMVRRIHRQLRTVSDSS